MDLRTKNPRAWKVSEGTSALAAYDWFVSCINKETRLEDWRFSNPREPFMVRPETLKRFSEERRGDNNPAAKVAPKYDVDKIKTTIKQLYEETLYSENHSLSDVLVATEEAFPGFKYSICSLGLKKDREILSWATDKPLSEVKADGLRLRGQKISRGLKNSPTAIKKARELAVQLWGWRVSKPQRTLYNKVLQFDSQASLEKKVILPNHAFSYDIFSPKINALIEMNGRFWHELLPTGYKSGRLEATIRKNIQNDLVKKETALALGYQFVVFWDDQQDRWDNDLSALYKESSQS